MSVVGWIIFGLITGFVASSAVNNRGEGCILNVVLGIVGACVGGFIFTRIGGQGITGFNLYSMFVAVVGAIVVISMIVLWRRKEQELAAAAERDIPGPLQPNR